MLATKVSLLNLNAPVNGTDGSLLRNIGYAWTNGAREFCEPHVVSSDLTDFYATNDDVQFVYIYIYVDLINNKI